MMWEKISLTIEEYEIFYPIAMISYNTKCHIYYKTDLESPGTIPGTLTDVYLRLAGTFDHSSVFYIYLLFLVGQWLRCLGPTLMARVQSPEESISFFFSLHSFIIIITDVSLIISYFHNRILQI